MNEMNQPNRIVIIGAGYAGMLAALRLAGRTKQAERQITVINPSAAFVERTRLHQIATHQSIRTYSIPKLLRGKGITFLQGTVTTLNPTKRELIVETQTGSQTAPYDQLLYTLGSRPAQHSIPGVDLHCFSLDHASVERLAATLPDLAARRATLIVVGGGLTGIETVTEIAEAYPALRVKLVTRGRLGSGLSDAGRTHLQRVFTRLNISIIDHTDIARIESDHLLTGAGDSLPFDACVWSVGFSVPSLAADSGIKVNEIGQIIVDENLRSVSHPSVFAAGDSAVFTMASGQPQRMACATAMPMGAHAAENIAAVLAGHAPQPFRFGFQAQCISLGRHNALIQVVNPDDSPKARVFTGRMATGFKEFILRSTMLILQAERFIPVYQWPHPSHAPKTVPQVIREA